MLVNFLYKNFLEVVAVKNEDILSKAGLKITKSRDVVLNIFRSTDKILSASEIYDICKDKNFNINLSTIYRICEAFSSKKILDKLINSHRINGYKFSNQSHFHTLSCNLCNKTIKINCPFNILSQYIENSTGFTLTQHDIDISGICGECKTRTKN